MVDSAKFRMPTRCSGVCSVVLVSILVTVWLQWRRIEIDAAFSSSLPSLLEELFSKYGALCHGLVSPHHLLIMYFMNLTIRRILQPNFQLKTLLPRVFLFILFSYNYLFGATITSIRQSNKFFKNSVFIVWSCLLLCMMLHVELHVYIH